MKSALTSGELVGVLAILEPVLVAIAASLELVGDDTGECGARDGAVLRLF